MDNGHINKTTVKYTKKDGTEVKREYTRVYIPVDKENKITQKKVIDQIRNIKNPEILKRISDFITQINI